MLYTHDLNLSGSLYRVKKKLENVEKKYHERDIMQLFSVDETMSFKLFLPQKVEKKHPQKLLKNTLFFVGGPSLPFSNKTVELSLYNFQIDFLNLVHCAELHLSLTV